MTDALEHTHWRAERELRLKIAAQILCRMMDKHYAGLIPDPNLMSGINTECVRWADALIDVHDHMHPEP